METCSRGFKCAFEHTTATGDDDNNVDGDSTTGYEVDDDGDGTTGDDNDGDG